ncbi:MFS transporter [Gulosibacter chungangensis]|uniref:MFS transporter n=1 Tax=Gulosibacter chungangensis TaxID=979746 RepID=A0A7J5B7T7_9MICO|nr:MFS transporter [Gulosibacter chungangensis]KAB1641194.1 MFS transporter [Gulosibacter chungangensis]
MSSPTLFRPSAILGCLLGMVSIGLLLATYGPVISTFQSHFGVSESIAGLGLAFQSGAAVLGILAAPVVLPRLGNRLTMQLALGLMVIGSIGLALAPTWPLFLAAATVAGFGLGGIDVLITQLLIMGTGKRGPALVNVAHGCFGIGTVISPAVLSVIGVGSYPYVFLAAGLAVFVALLTMRGLQPRPTPVDAEAASEERHDAPRKTKLRLGFGPAIITAFVALYVTHFGVQSGIGSWEPSFLQGHGVSADSAAMATSGYWLAMVVGRFAAAALTRVIAIPALVIASCVGMAASLLLALHPDFGILAFALCGFFIGPIFPNGLTWLAGTEHATGHRFAWVVAGSMIGQALTPWLVGVQIERNGVAVLPGTLFVVAAIAILASVAIALMRRAEKAAGRDLDSVPKSRPAAAGD